MTNYSIVKLHKTTLGSKETDFVKEMLFTQVRPSGREFLNPRQAEQKQLSCRRNAVFLISSFGKTTFAVKANPKLCPLSLTTSSVKFRTNLSHALLDMPSSTLLLSQFQQVSEDFLESFLETLFAKSAQLKTVLQANTDMGWVIEVEATLLYYDGNVVESIFQATREALEVLEVPCLYKNEPTSETRKLFVSKKWNDLAEPELFGFVKNEKTQTFMVVRDCDAEEELAVSGLLICTTLHGRVVSVESVSSTTYPTELFIKLLSFHTQRN